MQMESRVKLEIMGSEYVITSDERPEYIIELGETLNEDLRLLLEQNQNLSLTTALVLCALNYLDETKKAEGGADHLRSQIKEYLEDAAKARMEADEARREAERLSRELSARDKQ